VNPSGTLSLIQLADQATGNIVNLEQNGSRLGKRVTDESRTIGGMGGNGIKLNT
jgi:hypothetical protein